MSAAFRVVDDASPDRLDAPIRVEDGTRVGTRSAPGKATRDGASSPEIRGGRRRLTQASASDIFVELIVFNDEARVSSYGGDTVLLHDDSLHVLNVVAALYERSGFAPRVHPVLVAQVDFSQGDPWSSDVDAIADGERDVDATLEGFKDWRGSNYESLPAHDAGHLFSGEDFFYFALDADGNRQLDGNGDVIVETGVVGLAYQWGNYNTSVCEEREVCGDVVRVGNADGTTSLVTIGDGDCYGTSNSDMMCCRPHSSVALSQVWRDKISFDALTVAPRLDTSWGSNTTAWAARTEAPIWARGIARQRIRHAVSLRIRLEPVGVQRVFRSHLRTPPPRANKYQCLTSGYTRVCGNGLLEPGEQCDCGTHDCALLVDPCCDGDTCTLRDGATCSAAEGGQGAAIPPPVPPAAGFGLPRRAPRFSATSPRRATGRRRRARRIATCRSARLARTRPATAGRAGTDNASIATPRARRSRGVFRPSGAVRREIGVGELPADVRGKGAVRVRRGFVRDDRVALLRRVGRVLDHLEAAPRTEHLLRRARRVPVLNRGGDGGETLANGTNATLRVHPRVCSGGPGRNGVGSRCVDRESLVPSPPPPPSPITPPAPPLDGRTRVSAATGWGGVVLGASSPRRSSRDE